MARVDVTDGVTVVAKLFRGLADTTRLSIVLALLEGEHRVTDLVDRLGCSQANVSGHLACLKECDIVAARPEGRAVYYRLAHPETVELLRSAESLLALIGPDVDLCERYDRRPRRTTAVTPVTRPTDEE